MISINKNVVMTLSTKDKFLVSISFCTLGVGAVFYGLFYKLPNLIINAVSEERKFQQFIEGIEEKIVKLIHKCNNRGGLDNISIAYLIKNEEGVLNDK